MTGPLPADAVAARLRVLFETATHVQDAPDQAAVLAAVAAGLGRVGFNVHLSLVEPERHCLVIKVASLVPVESLDAVERRLGRPMLGIELDALQRPYDAVITRGEVVWMPDAAAWLADALPWIDERALRLFRRLPGVGQGVCVPITDGSAVLGAISVWGAVVSEADVPTVALLGRHAGGALTNLRLRREEIERARLDGVLLAAHTATHVLNNRLMLTVGAAELLAESPAIPEDLRPWVEEARRGALESAAALRQLQQVVRLTQVDHGPSIPPTLDLVRSVLPP